MTQFMRAHGYPPGATLRPGAAGMLSGIVALLASLTVLWLCGTFANVSQQSGFARAGGSGAVCLDHVAFGMALPARRMVVRHQFWIFDLDAGSTDDLAMDFESADYDGPRRPGTVRFTFAVRIAAGP